MNAVTTSSSMGAPPPKARRRHGWMAGVLRVLLVLLIALLALAASGAIYQLVAAAMGRRSYPAPGQLVDVGGYQLHIHLRRRR